MTCECGCGQIEARNMCVRCYDRWRYAASAEKFRAKSRAWRRANADVVRPKDVFRKRASRALERT